MVQHIAANSRVFHRTKTGSSLIHDSNPITRIATHTRSLHKAFIPRSILLTLFIRSCIVLNHKGNRKQDDHNNRIYFVNDPKNS